VILIVVGLVFIAIEMRSGKPRKRGLEAGPVKLTTTYVGAIVALGGGLLIWLAISNGSPG
jgi:hypothetical protein